MYGKIILYDHRLRRQHGAARITEDPKVTALRESRCLNPHPEQVTDPAFLAERVLRCPRRGAGQVRDGAPRQRWTARRSPRLPRRSGTPGRRTTRPPPRWPTPGWTAWCRPGPGPAAATSSPGEILAWAEEQLAADPAPEARRAWPGPSTRSSGCACTPARSSVRWPAAGSTPKAADLSARERGKEEDPSLSLRPSPGHAAAEPGPRPDAGQARAPGGGLDARYEQLRHAALHARATAFPLGLGVLTGKGVTAWRRALTRLTRATRRHASTAVRHRPPARRACRPAR